MTRWIVGTSGWQYDSWRGRLYPEDLPERCWLEHFAARFGSVEVNNTFYRLPERQTFERWCEQVPTDFVFAVKMSRYLTHIKRLRDPAEPIERFVRRAEGLGDRWGPTLLQLPPNLQVDVPRLRAVLERWPSDRRLVVEPRHESWFVDEVRELLTHHRVALCLADRRGRPQQPSWRTAPFAYVRFHEGARQHSYARRVLERWHDELASMWSGSTTVYVYFNNDQGGAAVRNARTFLDLVDG